MASPTYSAGTYGNVIPETSLAVSKQVAGLVDLSTSLGGALLCRVATGGTAPTAGTTFGCYRAYAASKAAPTATLAAAASAGATTLSVSTSVGIGVGQRLAVVAAATGVGELVTVTAAPTGTGPYSLTVGATQYAYGSGDLVFLVESTPSGGQVIPGTAWAASSAYGASIYPPPAWLWVVQAVNGDGAQAVTASLTLDRNPAFA